MSYDIEKLRTLMLQRIPLREPMTREERDAFPWGRVMAIHTVGEYTIIEYFACYAEGNRVTDAIGDETRFHVLNANIGCLTLDEALLTAIIYKYQGFQPAMVMCEGFARMLGIRENAHIAKLATATQHLLGVAQRVDAATSDTTFPDPDLLQEFTNARIAAQDTVSKVTRESR